MKKFSLTIIKFIVIGCLIGEIITRLFNLNTDIPKMYVGNDSLIKLFPNQSGNYLKGSHKWIVNKYGNYGYEPDSLNNLITIIGDSYIENIMNPPECHQAYFLSNMSNKFNFYPCARSGASFIEFMEMTKTCERLKPIKQLLYVHDGDFIESIMEIVNHPPTVQISLKNNKIRYPKLHLSRINEIMFNSKFYYYLYRNYFVDSNSQSKDNRNLNLTNINYAKIQLLLDYVKNNYRIDDIVLIFSPDTDLKLIELTKKNGFETFRLKSDNYKSWQLKDDSHWSCFGHEEAAKQVTKFINSK